ncbi:tetratricopeptide repeat protein [Mesorhizobium sophorae]|uniref:tetratricopeptide repeat protein n=1 Tax=Mesorhizobium sophorae TaxID=1300294 RepID=UPI00142E76D3|nr:tetratricopeptide repeat protein [Mesorhizobium sophorae]
MVLASIAFAAGARPAYSGGSALDEATKKQFDQAVSLRTAGKLDEAEKALEKIMKSSMQYDDVSIVNVIKERGTVKFLQKRWDSAARFLGIYYEFSSDDMEALEMLGKSLRMTGRYEEAEAVYERAVYLDPDSFEVLDGLQNIHRRLGDNYQEADRPELAGAEFAKALDIVAKMTKLSEGMNDEHLRISKIAKAKIFYEKKSYSEAVAAYATIVSSYPDFREAREEQAALAVDYAKAQGGPAQIQAALDLYRALYKSAKLTDEIAYSGAGFAEAAGIARDLPADVRTEAEEAAKSALLDSDPNDPYPHYASAVLMYATDAKDDAISQLKEAIKLERKRAADPYQNDYARLVEYEKLMQAWTGS